MWFCAHLARITDLSAFTSYSCVNLALLSALISLIRSESSLTGMGGWSIRPGVCMVILLSTTGSEGASFSSAMDLDFLLPPVRLLELKIAILLLSASLKHGEGNCRRSKKISCDLRINQRYRGTKVQHIRKMNE